MKTKILPVFVICFCVALTSNAQINAGRYLTGGSFNIYSAKYTQASFDSKNQVLNVNIQLGKVVKENTVVGVILSYGHSNNHTINFPDSNFEKNDQFSAGIFYRKYKRLLKDFYFFGEVDATYTHSKNSQGYFVTESTSKSTSDGGSVSFIPGISYAICKRMQLELLMPDIISFSYSHDKTDYINTNTTAPPTPSQKGNNFSFNTNLNSNFLSSFGIGFKFILGK